MYILEIGKHPTKGFCCFCCCRKAVLPAHDWAAVSNGKHDGLDQGGSGGNGNTGLPLRTI